MVGHAYLGNNLEAHYAAAESNTADAFADAEVEGYILGTDLKVADALVAAGGTAGAVTVADEDCGVLVDVDEGVGSEEEEDMTMMLLLRLREM